MGYVTTIVLVLFGVYVANSIYVIYHLFHLPECQGGVRKCLRPDGVIDKELEVGNTYMYRKIHLFLQSTINEPFFYPCIYTLLLTWNGPQLFR